MAMKGTKQPLVKQTLKPRVSRHGKLLKDMFKTAPVMERTVREVLQPDGTKKFEVVMVIKRPSRPMTDEEIQQARTLMVAAGPTTNGAKRNVPESSRKVAK